jgi:hypothetical protein
VKVLIACEFSGIVREAFRARGHEAWSCDLLPTEIPGNHIQGDVLEILNEGWDLMIAHPPCTYLSYAATGYWNQPGRARKRLEALDFFLTLWEAPIERICIENPLGCADTVIQKHDQVIEPYFFGDSAKKRTCLWLKNLPKLIYKTQDTLFEKQTAVEKPEPVYVDASGKRRYFTDAISGTRNGGHLRSKTFQGIANAMAEQFGF